jgi:hypothetical protein
VEAARWDLARNLSDAESRQHRPNPRKRVDAPQIDSAGEAQGNFFTKDSARHVEGFRRDGETTESTMDSDQAGNNKNQPEIELLYDEVLTAFADCAGLEASVTTPLRKGSPRPSGSTRSSVQTIGNRS